MTRGLSTLNKELTAATRIMQSSSNELRTLVSGKAKMLTNECYYIMPYNSRVDMFRLLAERYGIKSNVKFRSQIQVSDVSSHIEELWYNETVCVWMTIYIYIYIYMCVCAYQIYINVCICVCVLNIYNYIYICVCVYSKTPPKMRH